MRGACGFGSRHKAGASRGARGLESRGLLTPAPLTLVSPSKCSLNAGTVNSTSLTIRGLGVMLLPRCSQKTGTEPRACTSGHVAATRGGYTWRARRLHVGLQGCRPRACTSEATSAGRPAAEMDSTCLDVEGAGLQGWGLAE